VRGDPSIEPGLLDDLLAISGVARGRGSRHVMNLSIAALIVALISGVVGGMFLLGALATPTDVDAAEIEAGADPISRDLGFRRSRRAGTTYLVKGRLRDSQRVTIGTGNASWIYAPLVSDNLDGDEPPRIYFCARAADYARARDEGRFVGFFRRDFAADVRDRFAATGYPIAGYPYRLTFHDSHRADLDSCQVFLGVALLLAVLAIAGIWRAQRQPAAD